MRGRECACVHVSLNLTRGVSGACMCVFVYAWVAGPIHTRNTIEGLMAFYNWENLPDKTRWALKPSEKKIEREFAALSRCGKDGHNPSIQYSVQDVLGFIAEGYFEIADSP